jgi:hypothetical protein
MYPWAQTFVNVPPSFVQGLFPQIGLQDLLEEKSLLDCSEATAQKHAGPLTKLALQQITERWACVIDKAKAKGLSPVVEVHVHRLMSDQYPFTPGWHCSGVPRRTSSGQPSFDLILPEQFSVCVTLSSEMKGVSNTEYVQTSIKPKLWDKDNVYKDLNVIVDKMHPDTVHAKDGVFTWSNPKTIMRSRPATKRGVRLFVRLAMFPKPAVFNAVGVPEQVFVLSKEPS